MQQQHLKTDRHAIRYADTWHTAKVRKITASALLEGHMTLLALFAMCWHNKGYVKSV